MPVLTKEQKEAAKLELRTKITAFKLNTFDHWLYLMRADEAGRKAAGHSRGVEEMLKTLVKDYERENNRMMKPFDRGDFD